MKNKTMRRLLYLVVALAMALCLAFTACNEKEETPATVTATATFVGGTDATGTAPDPISVDAGTEITLPQNTFQKSGSAFDGWNDGAATYAEGAKYTLSKDTTFTALWKSAAPTPVTYTLTFALGDHAAEDAAVPAAQTLAEGATYTLPAAPKAAEGWQFDGWGSDKLAAGATYTMPASNTTLTAQWKEVQTAPTTYTVTVSGEGFTVSGLNAEGYAAGASVSFTVTVTDTEKEIDSVTSADVTITDNGNGSYSFTMPEKNVTITVTLKNKTVTPPPATTYTLTFALGDHAAADAAVPAAQTLAEGATYTLPAAPKAADGYEFDGWGPDKLAAGATYTMPASDTTLTAQWKEVQTAPKTYTVTFRLDGLTILKTVTVEENATVTPPTPDPTDPNGTKTFRYWVDDNGTQFDFSTPITSDLALEAYFRICVTFDLDGGTGTQPAPVWEESGYHPHGIEVTLPAADGYAKGNQILTGWTDGEETYEPGATETFTKSTKLTAVWGEKPAEPKEYSISYGYGNLSEGETIEGKAPSSPTLAKEGTPFTFPACTWTRKGYTFAGWKVRHWIPDVQNYPADLGYWANITEDVYQPNQTYTMPSEPVQLLATWTKATVTLKFDANGGDGEIPSTTFNYGDSFTSKVKFLDNTFTYAGHTFVGWAYTPSGPAVDEYSYTWSDCKDYVVEENGTYTLTLYAIWEEAAPAPATDFSALCGVWTNGEHSIVLSEAGADDGYPIGSAIVDGSKFYLLVMTTTGLIDMDALMESEEELPDPIITYQGSTSITCNNITYTQKTALSQPTITAADLEGKWTTADGAASLTFAAGKVTYAYSAGTYNSTLLCVDKYAVISFSMGSLVLTLNEAKTELAQSSGRTFVKEQQTPPPAEQPDLKYVGEVETTYKVTNKIVFKSIEMYTGNDDYARVTYTVNGTEHIDELKKDEENKIYTFKPQVTTGSWPGKTTTVSKWWKMYPQANPPFSGTSYSVGLSTNGIDLIIALSSGELGSLRLEGAVEPEPVDSTKYTGNVTFESNGFPKSATYIFTEISLLKDLSRATFTYTVDDGAPTTEEVALTIDEDNIYSFKLTKSGSVSLYLKVLDNGTLELLNTSFDTLGTFTKEGTVEPQPEPADNVFTGHGTYTSTLGSFVFTSVTIDTSKTVTTATIEATLDGQPIDTNVVELENRTIGWYSGEGTLVYYYTFSIKVSLRSQEFALGVLEGGNAIVICDTLNADELPIEGGKFTKAGAVEPEPEVKHTVTYDLGAHAAEGAEAPATAEYAKDDTVTVEAGVEGVIGYEFTGWSDGKGHTYTAGQTFTMPDEDVTLTAQYEAYTPTTKTLDDYLGVWKAPDGVDTAKDVSRIKIEKNGDVYTVSYENKYDEGNFVTIKFKETTAKKCLILTAEKEGMSPSLSWSLTMTFTADDTATVEIEGSTSEFTRTQSGTPGTGGTDEPDQPKTEKPADADGTYVNEAGTPEMDNGGYGELNYKSAELTGNTIRLHNSMEEPSYEDVTLTWDGNVATGEIFYYGSTIKVQVEAKEGQLEITFTYGNEDYHATFIKQASGSQGGGDSGDGGDTGDHGDSGDTTASKLSDFVGTYGYADMESSGWKSTSDIGGTVKESSNYLFDVELKWDESAQRYKLVCYYVNGNTGSVPNSTKSYILWSGSSLIFDEAFEGTTDLNFTTGNYAGATVLGQVTFSVKDGKKQITFTISGQTYTLVERA